MVTGPILIVDDEPVNLATLRQILTPMYNLAFARNGAEALVAAEKHHPALILLDIQMPDMDGYTVCRHLKAKVSTEHIPVIFITGLHDVGDEAAGFEAGGVDYLVKPVSAPIVHARVRTHLSLVHASTLMRSHRDAIYMLGTAGHYNDNDTGVHIWRMAAYSRTLAKAAGWDEEHASLLELAAPMHDTGKIGIPDAVLRKPGKLDEAEWQIMRTHTTIGFEILSKSDAPVFQMAATIALRHHERWDGSGYPDGLSGEGIPEVARIVAIADVFDALSMTRPYKESWPLNRILDEMARGSGNHFDPRLMDLFHSVLPEILEVQSQWASG